MADCLAASEAATDSYYLETADNLRVLEFHLKEARSSLARALDVNRKHRKKYGYDIRDPYFPRIGIVETELEVV